MKYLIIHTERTGSNHLCSLLHQTGRAGIADLENCGFFIGLKTQMNTAALQPYLQKQTTPNGVFGAKAGIQYFLLEMKRAAGLDFTMDILTSMDKFIWLRRRDKVAQAVSMYIAGHTKRWHSKSQTNRPDPPYNRRQIMLALTSIAAEEGRIGAFFQEMGITPLIVWYEDLAANPLHTVYECLTHLELPKNNLSGFEPIFEKQHNPNKQRFIELYRSGQ